MNDVDLIKLLGQSSVAVAALFVLAKIVAKIGDRMIAAIDRVSARIDEHTKTDTLALADVGNQVGALRQDIAVGHQVLSQHIAVLSTRVDTVIEWGERTPVGANFTESVPLHQPPSTSSATRRPTPRPGTASAADEAETPPERPATGHYSFNRPPRQR